MTKGNFETLKNKYEELSHRDTTEQIATLWHDVEFKKDLTRNEILELFNILFTPEEFKNRG